MTIPTAIQPLIDNAKTITVLTGAGMSKESGVPTFRDAQTGLWERYNPEELASIQGWERAPETVWAWYAWRIANMQSVNPNAGHKGLAELENYRDIRIYTQNTDNLHERAGSSHVKHVHGSIFDLVCADCWEPYTDHVDFPAEQVKTLTPKTCASCGGYVRPGVVWFGEGLPQDVFQNAIKDATSRDLVLLIGSSGIVMPAAQIPILARQEGVPVIEINPIPSAFSPQATYHWETGAATAVPLLVEYIAQQGQ